MRKNYIKKDLNIKKDDMTDLVGKLQSDDNFFAMSGGEVNHSKVLVLITPPSMKDNVESLTNEVANW